LAQLVILVLQEQQVQQE
jgi:ribosomal protein S10